MEYQEEEFDYLAFIDELNSQYPGLVNVTTRGDDIFVEFPSNSQVLDVIDELKARDESNSKSLSSMTSRLTESQNNERRLSSEIRSLSSQIESLKSQIESSSEDLSKSKAEYTQSQQSFREEIFQLKKSLESKDLDIEQLKKSLEAKELDLEQLADLFKTQSVSLATECGDLQNKIDEMTRVQEEKDAHIESLNDKLSSMLVSLDDANRNLENLTEQNSVLRFQNDHLRSSIPFSSAQSLKNELEQQKEIRAKCEESLEKAEMKISALEKKLETTQNTYSSLQDDYGKLFGTKEGLEKDNEMLRARLEVSRAENAPQKLVSRSRVSRQRTPIKTEYEEKSPDVTLLEENTDEDSTQISKLKAGIALQKRVIEHQASVIKKNEAELARYASHIRSLESQRLLERSLGKRSTKF